MFTDIIDIEILLFNKSIYFTKTDKLNIIVGLFVIK